MTRPMISRRDLTLGTVAGITLAPWPAHAFSLTDADAASGIRTALERGAIAAVGLLGRNDGFLGNPKVKIPLPGVLEDAAKLLRGLGQGKRVDELILAMNRAAEAAVPEAKNLLVGAVKSMSLDDAVGVLKGGERSATQYFEGKTRTPIGEKFLPIVTRATERVKLAEKYNRFASRASSMGLMKVEDANVQKYVTGKALDGLFLMIGEQEMKIRADPVGTGSAILRRVFGALK